MSNHYIQDQVFSGVDYTSSVFEPAEYENCRFINCNFTENNLSKITFIDCVFEGCNLSTANISGTSFQDIQFINCKMLGLHFEDCNPFLLSMSFDHCILNLCSFYKLKLKESRFNNCSLQEADFTEADLSGAVFNESNFAGAKFDHTNLEKADLRTAVQYSINPSVNKIKKAKFSVDGIRGLLDQYDIVIE